MSAETDDARNRSLKRIQAQGTFDTEDWGGCGCAIDAESEVGGEGAERQGDALSRDAEKDF